MWSRTFYRFLHKVGACCVAESKPTHIEFLFVCMLLLISPSLFSWVRTTTSWRFLRKLENLFLTFWKVLEGVWAPSAGSGSTLWALFWRNCVEESLRRLRNLFQGRSHQFDSPHFWGFWSGRGLSYMRCTYVSSVSLAKLDSDTKSEHLFVQVFILFIWLWSWIGIRFF